MNFTELQELLWKTVLMLCVAAPAAGARVLLQWAVDITTRPPIGRACVLFVASMLAAVTAVHALSTIPKLAGLERMIAALVGFLAQDLFVLYASRKSAWQRDPGQAFRDVRRWIAGRSEKEDSPRNSKEP
jgi:hypothetical protein